MSAPGRVTLVGAGPGDPDLLTLRAVRVLGEADVVLIDDLVDRRVLAHARPDTRVVEVGKRGGCRSTPQAFIEALMVQEALAGRRVVRLKGGDPFVFGRGGEECATLRAAGVAVDVVPGITSGLAAPMAAGIPVTHRDHARGVALVTGHAQDGNDEPDWAALAATGLTLVVYMGVSRLARIQRALLDAGMRPDMPVAVVSRATWPDERRVACTLSSLSSCTATSKVGSPAILIIGEVAALAPSLPVQEPAHRRSA